ncbi:MAG TPA: hypothetical protein VH062_16340 [Polyangiaceae bacterium]|jgi:hypothetical protein|nr:hypothetical protein [Polyangiaceae bacterium]
MTRGSFAIVLLLTGCGGKVEPGARVAVEEAGVSRYAEECVGETTPPSRIECTGLFDDVAKYKLADGVREYTPAVPLWSDGAQKRRFIQLPKGEKIDATDPMEWKFPLGTKVWKEFSFGGKRMETRLFWKTTANHWSRATYAWNDDDTVAKASLGGDVPSADGGVYHIPTGPECDQCHKGRTDRLLGFEQVSLGLDGAQGITLKDLVDEKLITPVPDSTSLTIGDDGTGLAAPALAWMHINCGTTCHNDNEGATAYGAGMLLRLDPTLLDGRAVNDFDPVKTTIGTIVNTPTWAGQRRIVPGDPDDSLLVKLITTRSTGADVTTSQMPPIASRVVDHKDADAIIAWIAAMPKAMMTDAGTKPPTGGATGGGGATSTDAGSPPSDNPDPTARHDAGTVSSGVKDAGSSARDGGVRDGGVRDGGRITDASIRDGGSD